MKLLESIRQDIKGSGQCMSFLQTKDDDIDRFLNQYRDIIEKVVTLRYPEDEFLSFEREMLYFCLLYTSPSPRDRTRSRMPSSA